MILYQWNPPTVVAKRVFNQTPRPIEKTEPGEVYLPEYLTNAVRRIASTLQAKHDGVKNHG